MRKLTVAIIMTAIFTMMTSLASAEIKLSGFAQAQLVNDQALVDKEIYFTVKRARLIAKGDLGNKVGIFAQLETFTAAINVLDLVIDYDLGQVGKIGIGRFTIPFGLQNPVSPYNLHTINYAQVVQKLIGSGGRDFGARLTGKYQVVDWTVAVINGADGGTTVISTVEDNNVKDVVARVGITTPVKGLGVGISAYSGEATVLELTKNRTGADIKYEQGPVYAQAEFINGKDGLIKREGYYLEAGYKFGKLQPIVRYDVYDGNTDVEDSSEIKILAGGVNLYCNDLVKCMFIYESKDDNLGASLADIDNDAWIFQTAVKF